MFALDLMLVYLIIVAFCSASMNIVRVFVLRLATPHAPPPTNYRSSSHSMFVMPFANASQSKSVIREKQFSCVHAGTVTRTIASLWSCDFPRAIPGQAPIERKSTRSLQWSLPVLMYNVCLGQAFVSEKSIHGECDVVGFLPQESFSDLPHVREIFVWKECKERQQSSLDSGESKTCPC